MLGIYLKTLCSKLAARVHALFTPSLKLHYFQSRSHAVLFMASASACFTNKNSPRNATHHGF